MQSSSSKTKVSVLLSSSSNSKSSSSTCSSPSSDPMSNHVWTAISLSSDLHPCESIIKLDPPNRSESCHESALLSLSTTTTTGSNQQFQENGGICCNYMAEFSSFCKKRGSETDDGDQRHKRMIKNRESAARSRARKQAYTNELEIKVKRLMEENAMLRKQLEKFRSAPPAPLPKKRTLFRTLSAPF